MAACAPRPTEGSARDTESPTPVRRRPTRPRRPRVGGDLRVGVAAEQPARVLHMDAHRSKVAGDRRLLRLLTRRARSGVRACARRPAAPGSRRRRSDRRRAGRAGRTQQAVARHPVRRAVRSPRRDSAPTRTRRVGRDSRAFGNAGVALHVRLPDQVPAAVIGMQMGVHDAGDVASIDPWRCSASNRPASARRRSGSSLKTPTTKPVSTTMSASACERLARRPSQMASSPAVGVTGGADAAARISTTRSTGEPATHRTSRVAPGCQSGAAASAVDPRLRAVVPSPGHDPSRGRLYLDRRVDRSDSRPRAA